MDLALALLALLRLQRAHPRLLPATEVGKAPLHKCEAATAIVILSRVLFQQFRVHKSNFLILLIIARLIICIQLSLPSSHCFLRPCYDAAQYVALVYNNIPPQQSRPDLAYIVAMRSLIMWFSVVI